MTRIAITGGIASGKSLFGQLLSQLGADVLDADDIVRALHRTGGDGAKAVAREFGRDYLSDDGATNRAKLGDLVFNNPAARRKLNDLIHPAVRRKTLEWRDAPSYAPLKAVLIPLLFESAWASDWDATLTVESPREARLARLAARGLARGEALARIAAQLSSAQRREKADVIIFNNGDPDAFARAAAFIFKHMGQNT